MVHVFPPLDPEEEEEEENEEEEEYMGHIEPPLTTTTGLLIIGRAMMGVLGLRDSCLRDCVCSAQIKWPSSCAWMSISD